MQLRRVRILLLMGATLFLAGCIGQRVKVFDGNRQRIGTIVVRNAQEATVYVGKRTKMGTLKESQVFDAQGTRLGRVDDTGNLRDVGGALLGRYTDKQLCVSLYNETIGLLEKEVPPEAGASACFLLFFVERPVEE